MIQLGIIVLGPKTQDINKLCCFTAIYQYHYIKLFEQCKGIECQYYSCLEDVDFEKVTHLFAAGRYFTHHDLKEVKKKLKGKLFQAYEIGIKFPMVDVTCGLRGTENYIGWAADSEVFKPKQDPSKTVVLIDHPSFRDGKDYTDEITKQLIKNYGKDVQLLRLVNNKVEEITVEAKKVNNDYNRKTLTYLEFAKLLCKCDYFVVTHSESLGQCVLEAAMCGCLPLEISGCIPDWQGLVHHSFNTVEKLVLPVADKQKIRESAIEFTWDNSFDNLAALIRGNNGKG